jgi:pseudaminic acid biosynthesis-associated methylase
MKETEQIKFWKGDFGKEYIERNTFSIEGWDAIHIESFGVTKRTLNDLFLGNLSRDIRILEVGCNIGQQLRHLELMGFKNLFGIDIQERAVVKANTISKNIKAVVGSILEIPFEDDSFDLVFTSGVLIHIHPNDLDTAMKEMYRCSKSYISGFEYFSRTPQEIMYRGHSDYMWKMDYCQMFQNKFPELKILMDLKLKYLDSDNVNQGYLLKKY